MAAVQPVLAIQLSQDIASRFEPLHGLESFRNENLRLSCILDF
jgi:hypothetical protein